MYEVLGVSIDASADAIRRSYRRLVLRYHPDRNPSPDAALKIKAINQAYHILGDTDRRAMYDAERSLGGRTRPGPEHASPSHPGAQGKPQQQYGWTFDGFGRAPSAPSESRPAGARPAQKPSSGAGASVMVERILSEARLAFINRRYGAVESLCRDALRVNPRSDEAYEILGDLRAKKGEWAAANTSYSYAIQFNPRNARVQSKLDQLMGKSAAGPAVSRGGSGRRKAHGAMSAQTRELLCGVLSVGAIVAAAATAVNLRTWIEANRQHGLSYELILALAAAGAAAGLLLGFYGGMRPLSENLVRSRGVAQKEPVIGMLLFCASLLWFYASLLIFVGYSIARGSVSPSLARLYSTVLAL
ncbi:MAG TPA: DnaJ domain-containing protein, partial [Chthonomonadales bacterium]|nr:DnaJ domain-containing protein [Chthonomonadales bacterium]